MKTVKTEDAKPKTFAQATASYGKLVNTVNTSSRAFCTLPVACSPILLFVCVAAEMHGVGCLASLIAAVFSFRDSQLFMLRSCSALPRRPLQRRLRLPRPDGEFGTHARSCKAC